MAANIAIIAMTTNNSMSVKATLPERHRTRRK